MLSILVGGVKRWSSLNEELKHPFTNMKSLVLPNTGRKSCNVITNEKILLLAHWCSLYVWWLLHIHLSQGEGPLIFGPLSDFFIPKGFLRFCRSTCGKNGFFLPSHLDLYPFWGNGEDANIGEGRFRPWMICQFIAGPYTSISGFDTFVCTGTWTENPLPQQTELPPLV